MEMSDFDKVFYYLTPYERQILALTSLTCSPIMQHDLISCLLTLGVFADNGKNPGQPNVKAATDRLKSLYLLRGVRETPGDIADLVFRKLLVDIKVFQSPHFAGSLSKDDFVQAIQKNHHPRNLSSDQANFMLYKPVRLAYLQGDSEALYHSLLQLRLKSFHSMSRLLSIICLPEDGDYIKMMAPSAAIQVLGQLCEIELANSAKAHQPALQLAEEIAMQHSADVDVQDNYWLIQINLAFWQGRLHDAKTYLEKLRKQTVVMHAARGSLEFFRGNDGASQSEFMAALKLKRKESGRRKVQLENMAWACSIMQDIKFLLQDPTQKPASNLADLSKRPAESSFPEWRHLQEALKLAATVASKKLEHLPKVQNFGGPQDRNPASVFELIAPSWYRELKDDEVQKIKSRYLALKADGAAWLAAECALVLRVHDLQNRMEYESFLSTLKTEQGLVPFSTSFNSRPHWEQTLNRLSEQLEVCSSLAEQTDQESDRRLAWLIEPVRQDYAWFIPVEQIRQKQGWSKGRPVALQRLYKERETLPYLTQQDIQACWTINERIGLSRGYTKLDYTIDRCDQTAVALIGHPHVFLRDDPKVQVELVKGDIPLVVKHAGDHYELGFSQPIDADKASTIIRETTSRFRVNVYTIEHHKISKILGGNKVHIPLEGKDELQRFLARAAQQLVVHSDFASDSNAERIKAQSQPILRLKPVGHGLEVAMLVKPLANRDIYLSPGQGRSLLLVNDSDAVFAIERDLAAERAQAKELVAICEHLNEVTQLNKEYEWALDDPDLCLETLATLASECPEIVLEWPEGKSIRIMGFASKKSLNISIRTRGDWFEVSGQVQINQDLVIDLRQILEILSVSPSRYIELEESQFLVLTESFRKILENGQACYQLGKANSLRYHRSAGMRLYELMKEAESSAVDEDWQEFVKSLQDFTDYHPAVPHSLAADLRDYQVEGFKWMARMAKLGCSVCLADDMGLGKTLQTIALLLYRQKNGPALVIAPSSVCLNWMAEVRRFAPGLNPISYEGSSREQILAENLSAGSVVIVSYNLMRLDQDRLARHKWATVVLDEAQAIKNSLTSRYQAVMSLSSEFRIALSGTPVENCLKDLWSLFNFLNPGLLGNHKTFEQKFERPIESGSSPHALRLLKSLIKPFLLRRTKAEVLDELPPKTEKTRRVLLSPEELALYEAVRIRALERIEALSSSGQSGIEVLAELMRLRRICCDPRLVLPETAIKSSKLHAIVELVQEILANRHQILIFSQFVDFLKLIEQELITGEISYLYLDGSTPKAKRQERIEAFQSGQAEVFLISLRAGGTGINLTAADYVINADPWWNPAVEDQAVDRAHRLGQTRPVTVYRMVSAGTIEEKILELHGSKRQIADDIISGADPSRLAMSDLVGLIKYQAGLGGLDARPI